MAKLLSSLRNLLPFLAGVALLYTLPKNDQLVDLERKLFYYPERGKSQRYFARPGGQSDLVLQIDKIQADSDQTSPHPVYQIDQATLDILGVEQLSPANWAYLIKTASDRGLQNLALTQSLSWQGAPEIPLRALDHQLSQLRGSVQSLELENHGLSTPLPDYLQGSSLTRVAGFPSRLPEADTVKTPPSSTFDLYAFSNLLGGGPVPGKSHPLLIAWGDHLLLSTELAVTLTSLGLSVSDLQVDPEGYLRFGNAGPVIALDDEGRTPLQKKHHSLGPTPISFSQILLDPSQSLPETALFTTEDQPLAARRSAALSPLLARRFPELHKIYRRTEIWKEALFLALLTFSLLRRWFLLALFLASAYYFLPLRFEIWPPLLPFLATILAFFIFHPLRQPVVPEKEAQEDGI